MQNVLIALGRMLFALPFAIFGIEHLVKGNALAGARWAGLGLALLMLIFVVFVHIPHLGTAQGHELSTTIINLLKDLALGGASLGWAGYYWVRDELGQRTTARSHEEAHASA